MKKTYFLLTVLICIILVFVGCSNSENSNNFKIENQHIDNRLLYNKINNLANKEYLEEVFADDFKVKYESMVLPENYDEIKNSLIEDMSIIKDCEEKQILVDQDSAAKYAKIEYDNLNKDSAQIRYASFLENALSEYKLSEKEYLDLLYEEAYYKYNRSALKGYFYENLYKKNDNKTLEEQFSVYVETLLK